MNLKIDLHLSFVEEKIREKENEGEKKCKRRQNFLCLIAKRKWRRWKTEEKFLVDSIPFVLFPLQDRGEIGEIFFHIPIVTFALHLLA